MYLMILYGYLLNNVFGKKLKIVGGEIAKYGEFPYFVSVQMYMKVRTFTSLVHFCGGSILSEYVILTAGHCCFKKNFSSRKYYIAAGIINLDDVNPYKIAVAKCIIHPDFNENITDNDIALLLLERSIDFTSRPNIRPVLYSSKPIQKHRNCSVMGFGAIDENAQIYSPELRTVMQTVNSSQFCGKFFKSFNPYSMFCAGVFLGEEGACIGDSGSPLVCSGVIYGVVSHGVVKCVSIYICLCSAHKIDTEDWENQLKIIRKSRVIIGGYKVNYAEFPFVVSLQERLANVFFGLPELHHFCGGSIISENCILTAAHCFINRSFIEREFYVVAGMINLYSRFASRLKVKKFIMHPEYKNVECDNDIGILVTEYSLKYNRHIQPVKFALEPIKENQTCVVIGFGLTDINKKIISNDLKALIQTVCNPGICFQNYFFLFNPVSEFCAGGIFGLNVCTGDSGSPFVCNGIVYGVVSLGSEKCAASDPTVYVNISFYNNWINDVVSVENGKMGIRLKDDPIT
ncbi:transmembrane protease serine 9-like [Lycorma delicatula]|uniref:transmembrane protease serine 9-like n=1 Tax=Lycorma delicatula TaxID=130591 RepID=UPI003F51048F